MKFIPIDQLHYNTKDLTGKRFTRLVARGIVRRMAGGMCWFCDCDCGGTIETLASRLIRGKTQSCGCLVIEHTGAINRSHEMTGTREYVSWTNMRHRCNDPNDKSYPICGGIGITFCPEWSSFEKFYKDMGDRPKGMALMRIDQNADYSKSNCVWATQTDRANNRKTNHHIEHNGHNKTIAEWSRVTGINPRTIRARLNKCGWSIEKTLTLKPTKQIQNGASVERG